MNWPKFEVECEGDGSLYRVIVTAKNEEMAEFLAMDKVMKEHGCKACFVASISKNTKRKLLDPRLLKFNKLCPNCGVITYRGVCSNHNKVSDGDSFPFVDKLEEFGVKVDISNIDVYWEEFCSLVTDGFDPDDAVGETVTRLMEVA
jgi:hypothetical protein